MMLHVQWEHAAAVAAVPSAPAQQASLKWVWCKLAPCISLCLPCNQPCAAALALTRLKCVNTPRVLIVDIIYIKLIHCCYHVCTGGMRPGMGPQGMGGPSMMGGGYAGGGRMGPPGRGGGGMMMPPRGLAGQMFGGPRPYMDRCGCLLRDTSLCGGGGGGGVGGCMHACVRACGNAVARSCSVLCGYLYTKAWGWPKYEPQRTPPRECLGG
jgi:hypothetical protein